MLRKAIESPGENGLTEPPGPRRMAHGMPGRRLASDTSSTSLFQDHEYEKAAYTSKPLSISDSFAPSPIYSLRLADADTQCFPAVLRAGLRLFRFFPALANIFLLNSSSLKNM